MEFPIGMHEQVDRLFCVRCARVMLTCRLTDKRTSSLEYSITLLASMLARLLLMVP